MLGADRNFTYKAPHPVIVPRGSRTISNQQIALINLGCESALVFAERVATGLQVAGISLTDDPFSSDLTLLAGCKGRVGALYAAEELIADLSAEGKAVLAMGFNENSVTDIRKRFPGIASAPQTEPAAIVAQILEQLRPETPAPGEVLPEHRASRLTPPHYAYVNMAEHCNSCGIPYGGDTTMRPTADILDEAEYFASRGVEELILINPPSHPDGKTGFSALCQQLSKLGLWIRFAGLTPTAPIPTLLPLMAEGLILPYLDIRFDHVSPPILRSFNNPAAGRDVLQDLNSWRVACPGLAVRGSFTVGAPEETEEDFQQLMDWLTAAQLDRITCHTFSERSTAGVPSPFAEHRRKALIAHQHQISEARFQTRIGRVFTVLVEEVDEEGVIARSFADAPNIDGCVFLNGETSLQPGQMVEVEIEHADEFDLWARLDE